MGRVVLGRYSLGPSVLVRAVGVVERWFRLVVRRVLVSVWRLV